ncbi:MAG: hypothetical protein ABJE10_01070 [bacterium]
METVTLGRDIAREHLDRVLASAAFRGAERSSTLLRFLVEETVDGRGERLKEYTLGAEGLKRGVSFDPRTDPIVRAEASRLRSRLERYYASEGSADRIVIVLPKGSYVPYFQARDITESSGDATAAVGIPQSSGRRPWRSLGWVAIAVAVAIAAFIGGLKLSRERTELAPEVFSRFDVRLDTHGPLSSEVGTSVVLAPDGTRLAFVASGADGVTRLSTRGVSEAQTIELPGTEGARGPFFSPDGRWLGFWAAGKLKKIPVEGGSPVVLSDAPDLLGASWGEDGTIIATLNSDGTLWRVSSTGGVPSRLGAARKDGALPRWPQILPGGSHVMYSATRGLEADRGTIEVLSLKDGTRKVVARGGTFARYLTAGFLSYINQGTLYVVPFDLGRMETSGQATPVLDGIAYSATFGYAQLDVSTRGTVVYRKTIGDGRVVAVWLDSSGTSQPLLDTPGRYVAPRLSADGSHFSMTVVSAGIQGVEFYGMAHGSATHLPASASDHGMALWTPDSRFVVMHGPEGLSWAGANGDMPQTLLQSNTIQIPWTFTPNGDRLAYHEVNATSAFDLWTVPIHRDARGLHAGVPELYLRTPSYEVYPSFSPDGRWLAYGSDESGTWEVYVRRFPDDGTKIQVSVSGGRIPRWSLDGRDLFYRTDGQQLMVVRYVERAGSFVPDAPRAWGPARLADTGVLPNFDLAADGRVVALIPAGGHALQQQDDHVTLLTGFFAELRRRVSAGVH